jgi:hypothetical protein
MTVQKRSTVTVESTSEAAIQAFPGGGSLASISPLVSSR